MAGADADHTPSPARKTEGVDIFLGHTSGDGLGTDRRGSVAVPNGIGGHPAWINAKAGAMGIVDGSYTLYINQTSPAELLAVARSLDLAPDFADQSTWFTTAEAFG